MDATRAFKRWLLAAVKIAGYPIVFHYSTVHDESKRRGCDRGSAHMPCQIHTITLHSWRHVRILKLSHYPIRRQIQMQNEQYVGNDRGCMNYSVLNRHTQLRPSTTPHKYIQFLTIGAAFTDAAKEYTQRRGLLQLVAGHRV